MGEEVEKSRLTAADAAKFRSRLAAETALFARRFADGRFAEDPWRIGYELEICIVDASLRPAAKNAAIITALNDGGECAGRLVPELAQFNAELISPHLAAEGAFLDEIESDLARVWDKVTVCAATAGVKTLLCGVLPTAAAGDFSRRFMSKSARYRALDSQLMKMRGRAVEIDIQGRERLTLSHEGAMLESLTTSLQVHLQVPASAAAAVLNAAAAASAPLLAAAANSPFALGRDLWAESRVPLFEQAVDTRSQAEARAGSCARVFLGEYAESPADCFAENLDYQPIVPPPTDESPPDEFRHLRLHNGTIWRWVRPLLGENGDGKIHLRIEQRVMPAGPTIADVAANIGFCVGLIRALADKPPPPFAVCRDNFYAAAKDGMEAALQWPDKNGDIRRRPAAELIREEWLPRAAEGLADLGAGGGGHLDVIAGRAESGQNGAVWQRRWIAANGRDFPRLTAAYIANSESGLPVHRWPIKTPLNVRRMMF